MSESLEIFISSVITLRLSNGYLHFGNLAPGYSKVHGLISGIKAGTQVKNSFIIIASQVIGIPEYRRKWNQTQEVMISRLLSTHKLHVLTQNLFVIYELLIQLYSKNQQPS